MKNSLNNLLVPMYVVVLESMKRYRLMSNDAIHVATMEKRGISDIATNDPDFERVGWLKVWKP